MTDKIELNSENLTDVNGGSIWIREEKAKKSGIELRKEDGTPGEWGYLWNSGDYYFKGQKLSQSQAARLCDFYEANGRPAESLEECQQYWSKIYRREYD